MTTNIATLLIKGSAIYACRYYSVAIAIPLIFNNYYADLPIEGVILHVAFASVALWLGVRVQRAFVEVSDDCLRYRCPLPGQTGKLHFNSIAGYRLGMTTQRTPYIMFVTTTGLSVGPFVEGPFRAPDWTRLRQWTQEKFGNPIT